MVSRAVLLALVILFVVLVLRAIKQPEPKRASGAHGSSSPPRGSGRMSREEALKVLGLKEGASKRDILAQYRRLIKKVHPDHPDGSTYLASQLNQAKEVLLG